MYVPPKFSNGSYRNVFVTHLVHIRRLDKRHDLLPIHLSLLHRVDLSCVTTWDVLRWVSLASVAEGACGDYNQYTSEVLFYRG